MTEKPPRAPAQPPAAAAPHGQRTVYRTPPPDPATPPAPAGAPADTQPVLVVVQGPHTGARHPVATDRPTTLGRLTDSDIVLADSSVSRRHATIRPDEHGRLVLSEAGSLNGTYLNGSPVVDAVLHDGDTITLGGVQLTFQAPHPGR